MRFRVGSDEHQIEVLRLLLHDAMDLGSPARNG
jgi:hypothetical protein